MGSIQRLERHQPEQSGRNGRLSDGRAYLEPHDRIPHAPDAVRVASVLVAGLVLFAAVAPAGQVADPGTVSQHVRRAQQALGANDSDRAEHELKEVIRLKPDNANAYANLGVIALSRADYTTAAHSFESAIQKAPSLWSARALLGVCRIRTGDRRAGEKLIEESLPHVDAAVVRKQAGLALADSYASSDQIGKAAGVIESLRRGYPDDADILYATYRIFSDFASGAVNTLAHTAPGSARVHELLGQNLLSQDNASGAVSEYRRALESEPHLPGLHFELGQALLLSAAGNAATRAEAEKEFSAELAINPADPNAWYELGEFAFERGEFSVAADHFRRALAFRPDFAEARIALGKSLAGDGKISQAVEQYSEAIRLAPDNDVAHYRLAQAYKKLGHDSDARQELQRYSELKRRRTEVDSVLRPIERRTVREQSVDSEQ